MHHVRPCPGTSGPNGVGVVVNGDDRTKPEAGGGDGQHASATAGIKSRTWWHLGKQLEGRARGGVLSGAKGHSGVDHHIQHARRRRHPWRAHPNTPCHHRLVKIAQRTAPGIRLHLLMHLGGNAGVSQRRAQGISPGIGDRWNPQVEHHDAIDRLALAASTARECAALGDGQVRVGFGHPGRQPHQTISGRHAGGGRRTPRRRHRHPTRQDARPAGEAPPGPRRM